MAGWHHPAPQGWGKECQFFIYGCLSVVTLELPCRGPGRSMMTGWLPPFKPTRKMTCSLADKSLQTSSWLIHPYGLSAFSWGRTLRCLSLGRGTWLVPSYNWVKTYSQSGPLGVQVDRIYNTSTIIDAQAW